MDGYGHDNIGHEFVDCRMKRRVDKRHVVVGGLKVKERDGTLAWHENVLLYLTFPPLGKLR